MSGDDSNFIQSQRLRAKDIPTLMDWMKQKQNKFMSHDIQNKIIQTMTNQITSDIATNIGNNFYSIISDKYREISNKKQLSFCIHWVDKFFVTHKEFLEFYEVPDIKRETLIRITKDILLRFQLSLKLCRGQCFDGTSNMLGKRSGVAIQIYKEQQRDTHAHCHSLNLSIKDVTRSS